MVRPSLVAVALFAVGVSLSACSGNESTNAPAEKSAAISGEQLRLAPSTVTDWKDVGALVTSVDMADARARISGILDSLSVLPYVAGAHTLNSYLERDLDRAMRRTRTRPLPAGRLDARLALWLGRGWRGRRSRG